MSKQAATTSSAVKRQGLNHVDHRHSSSHLSAWLLRRMVLAGSRPPQCPAVEFCRRCGGIRRPRSPRRSLASRDRRNRRVRLPACRRHSPAAKARNPEPGVPFISGTVFVLSGGAGICAPLYGAGLQPSRTGRPARRWCAGLRTDRSQPVGGPVCRRRRAPTVGGAGVVSGGHDRRLHSSTVRDRGGTRDHLPGGRRGRVRYALLLLLPSQARRHALL